MYMGVNQNQDKTIVKLSQIRTLYGNFSYKYATSIAPKKCNYIDMVAEVRFRYGHHIFYLNKYPVKTQDGEKKYNVTCPITGWSVLESYTNDVGVIKQELCRIFSNHGFDKYLRAIQIVCASTGNINGLRVEIPTEILTLIL